MKATALLLGLCLMMWTSSASAYVPLASLKEGGTNNEEVVLFQHWQQILDGVPIPFSISDAGTSDIELSPADPAIDEFEAIELAFRTWEKAPGVPVHFTLRRTTTNQRGFDGESVIFFADLGDVGYAIKTTGWSNAQTGEILEVDIHLNEHSTSWLTSPNDANGEPLPCPCGGTVKPGERSYDIQAAATHEIGAALGLSASAVGSIESIRSPTMYGRVTKGDGGRPEGSRHRTLELDDIIGLKTLYPPSGWESQTGTLTGVVHDRADQPLFGAHIVAKSLATGIEVGVMSGVVRGPYRPGVYVLKGLPPDQYQVRAEPLGSPPGLVDASYFEENPLVKQKFPPLVDLSVMYHRLVFDPALASPVRLNAGETKTITFRPIAALKPLPRFLRLPQAFEIRGSLNVDVTGPLRNATLVYTVNDRSPIAVTLPLSGQFTVRIPNQPSGAVVAYRVEVQTRTGETLQTQPASIQVGLSGEPLLLMGTASWKISVIDTKTFIEVDEITDNSFFEPRGLAFHPTRFGVYVADRGTNTVTFVPLSTGQPGEDNKLFLNPTIPIHLESGAKPYRIVLSPDQRYLYVAGNGTNTVYKIDTTTNQLVGQVAVGARLNVASPKGVAVSPDGAKLYVPVVDAADSGQRYLLIVVDAATLAILKTINLPARPHFVTLSGNGTTAVVTMSANEDVAVIDTTTDTLLHTLASGLRGVQFLAQAPTSLGTILAGTFSSSIRGLALINPLSRSVQILDLGPSIPGTSSLAIHPDGKRGYAVHLETDPEFHELVEFRLATGEILRRRTFEWLGVNDLLIIPALQQQQASPILTTFLKDGRLVVSWAGEGVLQSAESVTGPWRDVEPQPKSPFSAPITSPAKFYRLRQGP